MNNESNNQLELVQDYRKQVLIYEELDEKIDKLIMANGGGTANMSEADLTQYRELAAQRNEAQNEMRILEQQLSMDADD
jgi:hypothetical protein